MIDRYINSNHVRWHLNGQILKPLDKDLSKHLDDEAFGGFDGVNVRAAWPEIIDENWVFETSCMDGWA